MQALTDYHINTRLQQIISQTKKLNLFSCEPWRKTTFSKLETKGLPKALLTHLFIGNQILVGFMILLVPSKKWMRETVKGSVIWHSDQTPHNRYGEGTPAGHQCRYDTNVWLFRVCKPLIFDSNNGTFFSNVFTAIYTQKL